jgi:hypothetical protein
MKKKLSAFRRGKIVLGVIEDLKNLPNKNIMCINDGYSDGKLYEKIAKRSGIQVVGYGYGSEVDITEDISITIDCRIDDLDRKLNDGRSRSYSNHRDIEFPVSEKLKLAVDAFEKENIPSHGTCNTTLGEIFRAIQYIQYRAFNDGDLPWDTGSPTFMSYVYLKHQIDKLNYNRDIYGDGFEFQDEYLAKYGYGEISDVIEDNLAKTADFIKYQIMDLLLNDKIKDSNNEFDSRNFSSLKDDRY